MIELKAKGLSYHQIGKLFGLSRARIHQLVSGYDKLIRELNNRESYHYRHEYILERDKYACQVCGNKGDLLIHHIDENDHHNWDSNLVTLCNSCHAKLHHKIRFNNERSNDREKIRRARAELSLTQKQFGNLLGVTGATISRWENGSRSIPKSAFTIGNRQG